MMMMFDSILAPERQWFVPKVPRCDTSEGGEIEVTVSSELHAHAARTNKSGCCRRPECTG